MRRSFEKQRRINARPRRPVVVSDDHRHDLALH
jgi:hypothetical protein